MSLGSSDVNDEDMDMDDIFNQYLPQREEPAAEPQAKRRKTAPTPGNQQASASGNQPASSAGHQPVAPVIQQTRGSEVQSAPPPVQSQQIAPAAPDMPLSSLDNHIRMIVRQAVSQASSGSGNLEQVLTAQTRAITSAISSARQGSLGEQEPKVVEPRISDESWWLKSPGHDVIDNSQTKL